ncbi:hypothetical protein LshimejAT787_1200660 [Lyophyllum shimeji]|uniref:Uncharacterized protein n=1 Tax=Lyophyllum shimeji TaxID=47721 RepID=A0A9P3PWM1_LYOSH|nr:hypothetical protein LshimejAT787_1200660 [Lyophyllum shimeji]
MKTTIPFLATVLSLIHVSSALPMQGTAQDRNGVSVPVVVVEATHQQLPEAVAHSDNLHGAGSLVPREEDSKQTLGLLTSLLGGLGGSGGKLGGEGVGSLLGGRSLQAREEDSKQLLGGLLSSLLGGRSLQVREEDSKQILGVSEGAAFRLSLSKPTNAITAVSEGAASRCAKKIQSRFWESCYHRCSAASAAAAVSSEARELAAFSEDAAFRPSLSKPTNAITAVSEGAASRCAKKIQSRYSEGCYHRFLTSTARRGRSRTTYKTHSFYYKPLPSSQSVLTIYSSWSLPMFVVLRSV